MEALYPLANKRMLSQIQQGRVPAGYYQMLSTALLNTCLYDHCLICNIGEIDNPDMIGELADLLLRHEQVDWVMCYGCFDNRLLVSLRTQDKVLKAGDVIHNVVSRIGTGGGHASMAGGQIRLRHDKDLSQQYKRLERLICNRLLKALDIKTKKKLPLVKIPLKKTLD